MAFRSTLPRPGAGGRPRRLARRLLLNGLPYALSGWLAPEDPHFEALAEDVAQETLMRVLKHLDTFEGRSQFTTWAHKIAVRVALTELRRRRWKDVSLDESLDGDEGDATPWMTADPAPGPEQAAERADLMNHLRRMMREEFTERQLQAMMGVRAGSRPSPGTRLPKGSCSISGGMATLAMPISSP